MTTAESDRRYPKRRALMGGQRRIKKWPCDDPPE